MNSKYKKKLTYKFVKKQNKFYIYYSNKLLANLDLKKVIFMKGSRSSCNMYLFSILWLYLQNFGYLD